MSRSLPEDPLIRSLVIQARRAQVSRRTMLQGAGMGAAALTLAACAPTGSSRPTAAPDNSENDPTLTWANWALYLDEDDARPRDYPSVLEECAAVSANMAYTDELICRKGGDPIYSRKRPYDQETQLRDPLLVHHLVLMRTSAAREVVASLPRGEFFESMIFFEMAKRGAIYVPRMGYIWNRGQGLNTQVHQAQLNTAFWCREHM
jgi:hypothetical protein